MERIRSPEGDHGIDTQGVGRSDQCAYVSWVHHVFQNQQFFLNKASPPRTTQLLQIGRARERGKGENGTEGPSLSQFRKQWVWQECQRNSCCLQLLEKAGESGLGLVVFSLSNEHVGESGSVGEGALHEPEAFNRKHAQLLLAPGRKCPAVIRDDAGQG